MDAFAIYVINANKSYGQKKILNDFSMKVPVGCIYGLLGASGCGKTTLLSCAVGRKTLDSGEIYVLGGKPGTPGSGVPGPRVGYMPQDIALVSEFTVKDAIFYFGRILNMEEENIEEQFQRLKQLLELPPDNRQLKHCSGGQQRRVSFACAMVHKPQLLILDEPTVGLDPELRASIWNYLVKIAEEERTAVIITTHYIEEARQAHRIGLMRGGKLLAEESPDRLLQLFNTDNLEEVFLILSRRQEEGRLSNVLEALADEQNNMLDVSESMHSIPASTYQSTDLLTSGKNAKKKKVESYQTTTGAFSLNSRRLKSLFSKNVKQFLRNPGGMSFTFLFPIVEMLAFLLAVGGDPKDISLAVVNDESANNCSNFTYAGTAIPFGASDCKFTNLSCRFLDEIQDPMFELVTYKSVKQAFEDVRHGKVVGVMYIAKNFSDAFTNRINDGRQVSDDDLNYAEIKVWLDMSNRQIGATIKAHLFKLFQAFLVSVFDDCHYFDKVGKVPIRFHFEYGAENESYRNFMVPGMLLTIAYFLGTVLTCTIIVTDRLEGVWDRSIVAGVSSLEIVITHFVTQVTLVFIQTAEVIVLTFAIYQIDYLGEMWLIFLFTFVQGICGMTMGFLISVVVDTHSMANTMATGIFYPMLFLSGLVWPIEGQPDGLKYISLCLPFTIPTISLRRVLKKGYGLADGEVAGGMGIMLLWCIALAVISMLTIRSKR